MIFGFAMWLYLIYYMNSFIHNALAFTSHTTNMYATYATYTTYTTTTPPCSVRIKDSSSGGSTKMYQSPILVVGARRHHHQQHQQQTELFMAQVSEGEAKKGIDKVVSTLRKDKEAITELGKLTKVNNILGYGSPKNGIVAVRFNASFQKGGFGLSSVPLPFGLGQSEKSEGRGTMVGQVKASVDAKNGKVVECSVFRDLGYGRAFNLKVKK